MRIELGIIEFVISICTEKFIHAVGGEFIDKCVVAKVMEVIAYEDETKQRKGKRHNRRRCSLAKTERFISMSQ